MINIIERGGIHKTKHEFGPFNRKYRPKRNKKRALIVQRGVYSEHSFAGLNSPSRGRHVKNTARHPFLARQGLKRAAWRWKRLGRLIGDQITEMSERKGFVRRFLEVQPDPWVELGQQFVSDVVSSGDRPSVLQRLGEQPASSEYPLGPELLPETSGSPVPHFVVEFVDEKFCFLDVVEPEMILELYADIVNRMPEGMIPQVGDYQSFDPSDKDGTTGSRVRIHKGKIVEVQRLPTKWEGPYIGSVNPEPAPKPSPFSGFNRYRTVKVAGDHVLKPGEAIVCLPDGTFEPFMGRGATPHYGEPYEEDYVDTLTIAFGLPKDFLDPRRPERPSMGFIPKGELTVGDIRGIGEPRYTPVDWQLPPATPVPGRTIEHLAPGLDLITDSIHRPLEGELLEPVGHGWKIVKDIDVRGLFPIQGESVNVTDTQQEVMMTDSKRDILHVVLADGLNLTTDQMSEVTKAFAGFIRNPEDNVVVTAAGISVKILTVEEGQGLRTTSVVLDNETWNRIWAAEDIKDLTVVTTHESVTLSPEWPVSNTTPAEKPEQDDIEATLADLQAEQDQKDRK